MKLQPIIWVIQLSMIFTFLFFSFIPVIYSWLTVLSPIYTANIQLYYLIGVMFFLIGLITLFGIITLNPQLKIFSSAFFSFGVIFGLSDAYLLALGVIISWIFYEIWEIGWRYSILDDEYEPYELRTSERNLLNQLFFNQISTLGIFAWIALSLSWGMLFITTHFYIQLGREHFGTLGVSLSASMLILLYLIPRFIEKTNLKK